MNAPNHKSLDELLTILRQQLIDDGTQMSGLIVIAPGQDGINCGGATVGFFNPSQIPMVEQMAAELVNSWRRTLLSPERKH